MRYTTQMILPAYSWLKVGYKTNELQPGDLRTVAVAGCDVCVGKTATGKLFCLGDKLPPTGISLSVGGEVEGEKVKEAQYGNIFDPFTGQPEGPWCPEPPLIGAFVGTFMGGAYPVATFETRETFLGGDIEVLIDTNAKRAYEADYWKGLLDAQGKDDGSYY
jgi:nitrite reductase/ring-hydroxylating ferredoxin subunit